MKYTKPGNTVAFTKILLPTFYEYILIVVPVLIYVSLEATHKGFFYVVKSPEWAIATIFLCFQAVSLYTKGLMHTGKKLNGVVLSILYLGAMLMIIASTITAYVSLEDKTNTTTQIIVRMSLFLASTLGFFILVCSSKK